MSVTVFEGGRSIVLSDADLLGEGGEGRVFARGDKAYKVFNAYTRERADKLRAFPAGLPEAVIAPESLLDDRRGRVVGYTMRRVPGAVDFYQLGQRAYRHGRVTQAEVLALLRQIDEAVRALHRAGVVVGDLNDGNVVMEPGARGGARARFIDADSMQLAGHRCRVAHERFLDPRLYSCDLGRTSALSPETDFYALAVLAFASLLYVHPFGGTHGKHKTLLRRAEARHSALRPDVTLPRAAAPLTTLPDAALDWFRAVFEGDLREPLPRSLLDARFDTCACGLEHARAACPACATVAVAPPPAVVHGDVRVSTVLTCEGGVLLDVCYDRGLRHVTLRGRELVREDGARIAVENPPTLARVAGPVTYVGQGARVTAHGGAADDAVIVGRAGEALAADASAAGLVYETGGVLVRASDGTRIGQVLEGQTRLYVGPEMGFAFYRAGELTLSFVFDPRRGPLRQVDTPHLRGRLVDASVCFDGELALVTTVTALSGRLECNVWLVSGAGRLVASESGFVGSAALLHGVRGRALSRGAILTATPSGLTLSRPRSGGPGFEEVRVFPGTEALASPDSDLVVGPGGALYVVDHDCIRHLDFTPRRKEET